MEEDWDDETPEWFTPSEETFDPILALKDILPLAEFLSSAAPSLTFNAVKTGVEIEDDFRFETLEVEGFDDAYVKMCYHHGHLISLAVCHRVWEAPQIILRAPDVLSEH